MKNQLILFLCLIFLAACKGKTPVPLDEVAGCQVDKKAGYFVGKIDYQCVAFAQPYPWHSGYPFLTIEGGKVYQSKTTPIGGGSFTSSTEIIYNNNEYTETMSIYFVYLPKPKADTKNRRTEVDEYPIIVGKYPWGNGNIITPAGTIKEGVTVIRQISASFSSMPIPWLSSLKEQDNSSYFEVTKVEPYENNPDLLLVTCRFSCNLYSYGNPRYQSIRDAEFRGLFVRPDALIKK